MRPRLAVFVPVAWLVTGCGGADGDRATVPEIEGPKIEAVEIVGNDEVEDDAIVSGLKTRGPSGFWFFKDYQRYSPLFAENDTERIETYYKMRGFYSARVLDTRTQDTGKDAISVTFEVEEGQATHVGEVTYEGVPDGLENDELFGKICDRFERTEIFEHPSYIQTKKNLQAWMLRNGYAHAEIDGRVEVDRDALRADIRFDLDPGPLVRFGEVKIRGLERLPESVIRNRLAWERGEVYAPEALALTQGRLYRLGFFSAARVDIEQEGEPAVSDVIIRVNEGKRHELRLGGGFALDDTHYEVRARAGYTQYGFLSPLNVLRLDLRPAYTVLRGAGSERDFAGDASAELQRYDFLIPLLTGQARVFYRAREYEGYSARGPGVRLALDRPLFSDKLLIGGGWELRQLDFQRVDPGFREPLRTRLELDGYRVGSFDQRIAYDQRDDILDPSRGIYAEVKLAEAGRYAGSTDDLSYIAGTLDLRGYVPVLPRVVLAAQGVYGRALTGQLPIGQRYFAGGANSHRGFAQRHLSPFIVGQAEDTMDEEIPYGGDALAVGSLEGRFDLFRFRDRWVGAALFTDFGDVTGADTSIDVGNLHWAVGAGLRYQTLVGPVRVDLARRVTRTGEGEPQPDSLWAFHLSIGEAF